MLTLESGRGLRVARVARVALVALVASVELTGSTQARAVHRACELRWVQRVGCEALSRPDFESMRRAYGRNKWLTCESAEFAAREQAELNRRSKSRSRSRSRSEAKQRRSKEPETTTQAS